MGFFGLYNFGYGKRASLNEEKKVKIGKVNIKLVGTIIPIVLLMVAAIFIIARKEILKLSKDKLALASQNYSDDIGRWAGLVLDELKIYERMIVEMGIEDESVRKMLTTSVGSHEAYPLGIYIGNNKGEYFDASGWDPWADGGEYVVTQREWYVEGLEHTSFAFGTPYLDAYPGDIPGEDNTERTCVSATVRFESGDCVYVIAADVYLNYAATLVNEIAQGDIEKAFFATDSSRVIVADSDKDMVGKSLYEKDVPAIYKNINRILNQGKVGQTMVQGKGGTYCVNVNKVDNTDWYFVTCIKRSVMLRDMYRILIIIIAVSALATAVLVFITLRVSREMGTIKNKAKSDPLTKLLNRDGFRDMVWMALEANPNQGLLAILDMDNFKLINDQLGHPEGDVVLKRFAEMLDQYFNRNKDIVARIGGDEFAVFVGRLITNDEAEAMFKKFIKIFHDEFDPAYPAQKLSVSIGVSFVLGSGTYQKLYENADEALYYVKERGKNNFKIKK